MAPRDAGIYLFLGAEFDEMPNRNIEKISNFQRDRMFPTRLIFHLLQKSP